MIILTDAEKALDKIEHPLLIKKKNFQQIKQRKNVAKGKYKKPTTHIMLKAERWETFLLRSDQNQDQGDNLTTPIQHITGSPQPQEPGNIKK